MIINSLNAVSFNQMQKNDSNNNFSPTFGDARGFFYKRGKKVFGDKFVRMAKTHGKQVRAEFDSKRSLEKV